MHEYETSMVWSEGRKGRAEAPGLPPLDFASPPEFGGPGGTWTPEHAFVTAATSCILLTFVAIADFSKLAFRSLSASARGKLEMQVALAIATSPVRVLTTAIDQVASAVAENMAPATRRASRRCIVFLMEPPRRAMIPGSRLRGGSLPGRGSGLTIARREL